MINLVTSEIIPCWSGQCKSKIAVVSISVSCTLKFQGAKLRKIGRKTKEFILFFAQMEFLRLFLAKIPKEIAFLFVFIVSAAQNDTRSTEGKECAVFNDATFLRIEFHIIDERAGIAVVVLQRVFQFSLLVATDGNRTMVQVDAGVNGLKGTVGSVAFLVSADDIVAHFQRDDLFVVEHVLDHDDRAAVFLVGVHSRL